MEDIEAPYAPAIRPSATAPAPSPRRNGIRADATSAELSFARGTCAPRPRRRVDVCNVGTARSAARAGRAQGEAVLQLPATQVPLQIEQVKPLPAAAVEVELVAEDEEWSFACGAVRRRFVQRVFCVLACMAVAVAVCACVGVRVGAVRRWVQGHVAAYALAYVAVVAVYVPLALAPKARRRQPPLNYLWLVLLTLALGDAEAADGGVTGGEGGASRVSTPDSRKSKRRIEIPVSTPRSSPTDAQPPQGQEQPPAVSKPPKRFVVVELDDDSGDSSADAALSTLFETAEQRRRFVVRVYLLVSGMLLVCAVGVVIPVASPPARRALAAHPLVYYLCLGLFLAVFLALVCSEFLRRTPPYNAIALCLLAVAMAAALSVVSAVHRWQSVLWGAVGTLLVTLAVTGFAALPCVDVTGCGMFLVAASTVVLSASLLALGLCLVGLCSQLVSVVLNALLVLLLTLFLLYDTQLVLGARMYRLAPDEYVAGALCLWTDIVNIFLVMLSFND